MPPGLDAASGRLRRLDYELVELPGNSYGYFETILFERRVELPPGENLRLLLRSSEYPYSEYWPEAEVSLRDVDEQAFHLTTATEAQALLRAWIAATNSLGSFTGPGAAQADAERRASLPALSVVVEPYLAMLGSAETVYENADYQEGHVRSVYTWHREWIVVKDDRIRCFSAFLD